MSGIILKIRHRVRRNWAWIFLQTAFAVIRSRLNKRSVLAGYDSAMNFGDQLTPHALRYFGLKPILCPRFQLADVLGVGSILQNVSDTFSGTVLGSGLLRGKQGREFPFADIKLLRGRFSRDLIDHSETARLGDPGLIVDQLFGKVIRETKKHKIGLVPHYSHLRNPVVLRFLKENPDEVVLIDVRRRPSNVIQQIAGCDYIAASSLHGLIVADSFKIPSCWINTGDSSALDSFKFNDYYSCFDLQRSALVLRNGLTPDDLVHACSVIPEKKLAEVKEDIRRTYEQFAESFLDRRNAGHRSKEFPNRFLMFLCGDRNKASSRVRGFWIAEELKNHKCRCDLHYRTNKTDFMYFALAVFLNDVVVFQKTYSRWHCLLLCFAKLLKKTTILDLDDAPSRTNHPVTLRNVEFMMRNVSAVTVGSNVLKNYAERFSGNVHLIPSSIRLKYYRPEDRDSAEVRSQKSEVSGGNDLTPNNLKLKTERDQRSVTLGWIGNGKHYKQDLIAILKEPLPEVAKVHPIRFKLIGACGEQELYDAFSNIQGLEIDFIDQIEWSNPAAVATALQDIDIGLYPLLPGGSNEYKCGFKALEYMAMQIPVVSSDVAENREIIIDGVNGCFAKTSGEWRAALVKLIRNPDGLVKMGLAGRTLVENNYSTQGAASNLLQIIR